MGEIADMLIDGTLDMYTGEYIGRSVGYPRTIHNPSKYNYSPAERKITKVRKELAILIKEKQSEFPQINKDKVLNICREYINLKYGRGWRERGLISNSKNQWKDLSSYSNPEFNWELKLNN